MGRRRRRMFRDGVKRKIKVSRATASLSIYSSAVPYAEG